MSLFLKSINISLGEDLKKKKKCSSPGNWVTITEEMKKNLGLKGVPREQL